MCECIKQFNGSAFQLFATAGKVDRFNSIAALAGEGARNCSPPSVVRAGTARAPAVWVHTLYRLAGMQYPLRGLQQFSTAQVQTLRVEWRFFQDHAARVDA